MGIRTIFLVVGLLVGCLAWGQGMVVQTVVYKNGDLELRGFLYRPPGPGPFPAVVYNHGSEKTLAYIDRLAVPFVERGYVFFAPNRRGHGRSPGPYIVDELNQLRGAEWSRALVRLHEEQLSDQLEGVAFLKAQPFVDAARIGVFGFSFGGIQTMLAVERADAGYKAAVNCAGAAQTWNNSPELRARLIQAARNAVMPVFFIQAQNDYSLSALGPSRRRCAGPANPSRPGSSRPLAPLTRTGTTFASRATQFGGPRCLPSWTLPCGSPTAQPTLPRFGGVFP